MSAPSLGIRRSIAACWSRSRGRGKETIIVFTSDHGEMHGHHGLWGKGLPAFEDNQRVPLIVWGPSFFRGCGTTQALANLVDVTRTLLSLARIEPPIGIQGTDLMPVLNDTAASVQDSTVVECHATRYIYQQTFITDRYKMVLYRDDPAGSCMICPAIPTSTTIYGGARNMPGCRASCC
jgi:arylsulfatase A-like enzyme